MSPPTTIWFVAMVGVELLLLLLVAYDPLLRTSGGSTKRWQAVAYWLPLVVGAPVALYVEGVDSAVEVPQFMTAVSASLILFSFGRPAVVMDRLFQDEEAFPDWTSGLKWRGRVAVVLAFVVAVAVFVLLGDPQ